MTRGKCSTGKVVSGSANPAGVAILVSGGLDSAILLGELVQTDSPVFPLYVRQGLYWESAELPCLRMFLEACRCAGLRELHVLELPAGDLYGDHWSISGKQVPDELSTDEAVFLPGRNIMLLSKALIWCHFHGVPRLAMAPLDSNPFPDATPAFFAAFQDVVNRGLGSHVEIIRPHTGITKAAVMERGRAMPLNLTFSCIRPVHGRHCGRCNKCAERRRAFASAGMDDPTQYEAEAAARANVPGMADSERLKI